MNAVFVVGRFPPPLDGQTLATKRLATLLAAQFNVDEVNLSPPEDEALPADARFRLDRLAHYVSQRKKTRTRLARAPEATVFWASISPTVLGHLRDFLTVRPAFGNNRSVFAVVHRAGFDKLFESTLLGTTTRIIRQRVTGWVFLTKRLSEACSQWIPADKRFVIPNTVGEDLLFTDAEIASKHVDRRTRAELRLLFLGNMIAEKGYLDVLEAVRILHEQQLEVSAVFGGRWESNSDRETFHQHVHKYGLESVVVHHGGIADRLKIRRLLLEADAFLLPSYWAREAQPLSIIEALSAGTPVITTRQSGIPEMISTDVEGFLVPHRSPEHIAEALVKMTDIETYERLSAGARMRFLNQFSPEAVFEKWAKLVAN